MCLFRVESKTTSGAPAIAPSIKQDIALPIAQPTKDPDKVASVKYGTTKKDSGSAAANKVGTDALKINLNEDDTSAETGGINV